MEGLLCGNLAKEASREDVGAIFQLCWAIWKARNDCIFNANLPSPEKTIYKASLANADYVQAMFSSVKKGPSRPNHVGRWVPPPPSVIKFNVDGAFSSSRSSAAFGVIARDRSGLAQLWCFGRVVASSAVYSEAWALRIACIVAMEMNCEEAIFESDSLALINCFNDPNELGPWEIRVLIEDIKNWATSRKWDFVWCGRKKNMAAHWLASNCLSRKILFHTGCIPPGLASIIAKDSSS